MIRRGRATALLAGLWLVMGCAWAQDPAAQPPAGDGVTNPLVDQARRVEREGRILEILAALKITPAQAAVMADAMRAILSGQADLNGRLDQMLGRMGPDIHRYVVAVLEDAPEAFDPQTEGQVRQLIRQVDQLRTAYRDLCRQQYDRVYTEFTPAQVAGVETYEEMAAGAEGGAPEGGATLGNVVERILGCRRLDAATYAERAVPLAGEIARSIAGDNGQMVQALADRALALLEEARAMPGDPNPEQTAQFRQRVSAQLGLADTAPPGGEPGTPPSPEERIVPDCVTQAALENLMRDQVAYELLGRMFHLTDPTTGGALQ
jgi:hypothetical protein